MKVILIPIVIGELVIASKELVQLLEGLEISEPCGDHPKYKIDQNTEKGPWDIRRLVVTQTAVETMS